MEWGNKEYAASKGTHIFLEAFLLRKKGDVVEFVDLFSE